MKVMQLKIKTNKKQKKAKPKQRKGDIYNTWRSMLALIKLEKKKQDGNTLVICVRNLTYLLDKWNCENSLIFGDFLLKRVWFEQHLNDAAAVINLFVFFFCLLLFLLSSFVFLFTFSCLGQYTPPTVHNTCT